MLSLRLSSFVSLTAPLLLCVAARATPIYSSSRTDFAAQLSTPTVLNFNSSGGDYAAAGYYESGIHFQGFRYPSADVLDSWLFMTNAPAPTVYNFGTGGVMYSSDPKYSPAGAPYILISVPNLTAVGFDVMTYLPTGGIYGKDVDIWVTDTVGEYYQRISTLNRSTTIPPAFFGIISPNPITSIKVQATIGSTVIDNFTFGNPLIAPAGPENPEETPEVATIVMIGSGLLFLGLRKRRAFNLAV